MSKSRNPKLIQGNFTVVDPVETLLLGREGSYVQNIDEARRIAIVTAGLNVLVKRHSEATRLEDGYELRGRTRPYRTKNAGVGFVRLDGTLALDGPVVTPRTLARTGLAKRINIKNCSIGLFVPDSASDYFGDQLFSVNAEGMYRLDDEGVEAAAMTTPEANYLASLINKLGR